MQGALELFLAGGGPPFEFGDSLILRFDLLVLPDDVEGAFLGFLQELGLQFAYGHAVLLHLLGGACADTKQHTAAAERSSFFILLEKGRVRKYVE